jgi:hypothetical protein
VLYEIIKEKRPRKKSNFDFLRGRSLLAYSIYMDGYERGTTSFVYQYADKPYFITLVRVIPRGSTQT